MSQDSNSDASTSSPKESKHTAGMEPRQRTLSQFMVHSGESKRGTKRKDPSTSSTKPGEASKPVERSTSKIVDLTTDAAQQEGSKKAKVKPRNRYQDWMITSREFDKDPREHIPAKEWAKVAFSKFVQQVAKNDKGGEYKHWQMFMQVKAKAGKSASEIKVMLQDWDETAHVEKRNQSVEACIRYIEDDAKGTNWGPVYTIGEPDYRKEEVKTKKGKAGSRSDLIFIKQAIANENLTQQQAFDRWPDLYGKPFLAKVFADIANKKYIPLIEMEGYDEKKDFTWKLLTNFVHDKKPGRTIWWVWSETGGTGKTTYAKKLYNYCTEQEKKVLFVGNGETRDIAMLVEEDMEVFIFDLARATAKDKMPYQLIEQLSNGIITSTKYMTKTTKLIAPAHIFVFANTAPDVTQLSRDRFKKSVIRLDPLAQLRKEGKEVKEGETFLYGTDGMLDDVKHEYEQAKIKETQYQTQGNFQMAGHYASIKIAKEAELKQLGYEEPDQQASIKPKVVQSESLTSSCKHNKRKKCAKCYMCISECCICAADVEASQDV